uniref:Aminotransferase class I/classII domain-containing protein n=1 Tax=Dunaliella tertiolecta TaxID=3047 RepID=A0A6S8HF76_DUNTE
MRVLLRPGDHVVCTFPGYQSLYSIAASIGCTVSKWEPEMSPAPVFHVEKLQELVKSAPTRLVVVNFPHKWVCSSYCIGFVFPAPHAHPWQRENFTWQCNA